MKLSVRFEQGCVGLVIASELRSVCNIHPHKHAIEIPELRHHFTTNAESRLEGCSLNFIPRNMQTC